MRYSRRLDFLRDANAALDAIADHTLLVTRVAVSGRKLTFTYLTPDNADDMGWAKRHINDGLDGDAMLTGSPAARGLEELHVHVSPKTIYSLRLAALPSDALRALHLDGLQLTARASVPCSPVRRRLTDLQAIVDTAPLLAVLELDRVQLSYEMGLSLSRTGHRRRRCPHVTALSLASLRSWCCELELDMPSLQHIAYKVSGGREYVSLEQPGTRGRTEQIKELNLHEMKHAVFLRL